MDDLISEKEQIEQLRTWWSEYGGYVIGGLGLGIALLVGWNYWQNSKLEAELAGSAMYESLTNHVVEGKLEEAEIVAADLAATYANTPYAGQAKLAMARLYMDQNRDQDALDTLQELLDSNADVRLSQAAGDNSRNRCAGADHGTLVNHAFRNHAVVRCIENGLGDVEINTLQLGRS